MTKTLKDKIVALNKGLANHYASDEVFAGFGDVSPIDHHKLILKLFKSEARKLVPKKIMPRDLVEQSKHTYTIDGLTWVVDFDSYNLCREEILTNLRKMK